MRLATCVGRAFAMQRDALFEIQLLLLRPLIVRVESRTDDAGRHAVHTDVVISEFAS